MRLCSAAVFALTLSGCSTDMPNHEQARFASFTGMTMAEYMRETGTVPFDKYDTAQGRTFLVAGSTVTEYLPPAYGVPRHRLE